MERTKLVRGFFMCAASIVMGIAGLAAMYQFDKGNNVAFANIDAGYRCANGVAVGIITHDLRNEGWGFGVADSEIRCEKGSKNADGDLLIGTCSCSGPRTDYAGNFDSCKCDSCPANNACPTYCDYKGGTVLEGMNSDGTCKKKTCDPQPACKPCVNSCTVLCKNVMGSMVASIRTCKANEKCNPITFACESKCLTRCDASLECGTMSNAAGCTPATLQCGSNGGACPDPDSQECVANKCVAVPVDSKWVWGNCSKTCGGGKQTATCSPAQNGGDTATCTAGQTKTRDCNTQPCATPVNGVWTAWSPSTCPSSCTQTRTCTPPKNGGENCKPEANGDTTSRRCTGGSCAASAVSATTCTASQRGMTRCNSAGTAVETCNISNKWVISSNCPRGCSGGVCTGGASLAIPSASTAACSPDATLYRCSPSAAGSIDKCAHNPSKNAYEWATFACSDVTLQAAIDYCRSNNCSAVTQPAATCTPKCDGICGDALNTCGGKCGDSCKAGYTCQDNVCRQESAGNPVATAGKCTYAQRGTTKCDPTDSTKLLVCNINNDWVRSSITCGTLACRDGKCPTGPVIAAAAVKASPCLKGDGKTAAKEGDDCRADWAGRCGWDGKEHCYCGDDNKYVFTTDLKKYCEKCSADTAACGCIYAGADKKTATVPFKKSICGKVLPNASTVHINNTAFKCAVPGGKLDDMESKDCINGMVCESGDGCVSEKSECKGLTKDVLAVYENRKHLKSSGENKYLMSDGTCGLASTPKKGETKKYNKDYTVCTTTKAFLDKLKAKNYGGNFVKNILKKTTEDRFKYLFSKEDLVSCSEAGRKICLGDQGAGAAVHGAYTCEKSGYGGGTGACFVWDWVNGGSDNCKQGSDGKYCEYDKSDGVFVKDENGLLMPTGDCAAKDSSVVENGCPYEDEIYDVNAFKCMGGDDGSGAGGIVKKCTSSNAWVEIKDCMGDADCVEEEKVCSGSETGPDQEGVGADCTVNNPTACLDNEVCATANKTDANGKCAIIGKTACQGQGWNVLADTGVHFCSSSSYYQCKIVTGTGARWWEDNKCVNGCDAGTGKCKEEGAEPEIADCSSTPRVCASNDTCADCIGGGWTCEAAAKITDYSILGLKFTKTEVNMASKICVRNGGGVTPEIVSDPLTVDCNAAYTATGACVTCQTNKAFDSCEVSDGISGNKQTVTGGKNKPTSFKKCFTNIGTGETTSSTSGKSKQASTATFYVQCSLKKNEQGNPEYADATAACEGEPGPANTYGDNPNNPDNKGAEEGGECENSTDCESGLVCEDGTCITKQQQKEQKDKEKANTTPPTVAVTSPTGTVTKESADLKAITNIKSNCTYTDVSGETTVSDMVMTSSDGLQHSVAMDNLGMDLVKCAAKHDVTVICINAAAESGSSAAIGTGKTSFKVDLSQNSEYVAEHMPVVTSGLDVDEFTVPDPDLIAITDRPADCEYKIGRKFVFGQGKKFETTGSHEHSTPLSALDNNDGNPYQVYVICKEKEGCGVSKDDFHIDFKVTLEEGNKPAPTIENTTPNTQAIANPTMSVTTNIPAVCQYKKDSTFVYDDKTGTQFPNDGEYSHVLPLATYPDGPLTFYVACKGTKTGTAATFDKAITTTLSRSTSAGLVISNITNPNQTVSTPILMVSTTNSTGGALAANCKYNESADFTYETGGTQFTTDGGSGHSVTLPPLADGKHTFYVVCYDPVGKVSNQPGAQIIFTVNTASETCAKFKSNDRRNDNERAYDDDGETLEDSDYLWRSVSQGVRDIFTGPLDRYTGYQFTPKKKGYVTRLCGYFGDSETNEVALYSSSFEKLRSVDVVGEDDWACVKVNRVEVVKNAHYYVVAKVKGGGAQFEYDDDDLLPLSADYATVEAGIRQEGTDEDFGTSHGGQIVKYTRAVFGLVDVRIEFAEESTDGPEISSPEPSDTTEAETKISVETDTEATCRYSRDDVEYSDMEYIFGKTAGKFHEQKVCRLDDGPFTFYVRCQDNSEENDASTLIEFEVSD